MAHYKDKLTIKYTQVSIILLNILLLFIIVNIIAYFMLKMVKKSIIPTEKYRNIDFKLVYPNLSSDELAQLMNETWNYFYVYEPFTLFKEAPRNGKYVNVDITGFRNTENNLPWPPEKTYYNIFVFGGSTTFGYGVADSETVPAYLTHFISKNINRPVKVYNFGRGYYYSTQERILLTQLIEADLIPDQVIFIDGLNEFYFNIGEIAFSDPLSAFFKKPQSLLASARELLTRIYAVRLIDEFINKNNNYTMINYDNPQYINNVINRYCTNKKIVESICKSYNIAPVFVWQPVPLYKYDLHYHLFAGNEWGPHSYSKYGYPKMKSCIDKNNLGLDFLWCADIQENLHKPLYVDSVHYSASMSKMFAKNIVNLMKINGLFREKTF